MTLKMPGLNEEFRAVFANREFTQLQSFAISRSVAEAREKTLIAVNDTAVAQSCLFHIYVMPARIYPVSSLVILYIILVDIGVF
jgi:hypothetical protein